MEKQELVSKHSFRIQMITFLGVLIGLFIIPYIPIHLNPQPKSFTLNINFHYPNADALLVENEVTTRLEQAFARLENLIEVTSISKEGMGSIQLTFDKYTDIDQKRLEVAALLRQVYTYFDGKISFPEMSYESSFKYEQSLLTFTLLSNLPHSNIEELANEQLIQPLASIKGIERIEILGLRTEEWQLKIKETQLYQLNLTFEHISTSLQHHFNIRDIGWFEENSERITYVKFGTDRHSVDAEVIGNILIGVQNNRSIYLRDIAHIKKTLQTPRSYFRVNGRPGVNLIVYVRPSANQLPIAKKIKAKINLLKKTIPDNIKIFIRYDSTQFVAEELNKIFHRVIGAIFILFLMIWLIYPTSFLTIVGISLIASVLWSVIVFYLADLELHSYSIAGLTLSLGIVLDNIIIMSDHVAKRKNRRILTALLAANLTTIGVFLVIFLIDEKYREEFTGFIFTFSINLLVSLGVALWLIPTLLDKRMVNFSKKYFGRKKKYFVIKFNAFYERYILFVHKRKFLFYLVLLGIFGLPFFALPEKVNSKNTFGKLYNHTIGSDIYQDHLRFYLDKYLGGTLALFVKNKDNFHFSHQNQEQIRLYLRASLPYGSTLEQMNEIMKEFEVYLGQFSEISKFQTYINGYKNARIEIDFTKAALDSGFPIRMQGLLQSKSRTVGAGDFQIFGVGQLFNDAVGGSRISQHLRLSGYNYPELLKIAEEEKKRLLEHTRIDKVLISSRLHWYEPEEKYYVMDFESRDIILQEGLNLAQIGNRILKLDPQKDFLLFSTKNGKKLPIRLLSDLNQQNYFWEAVETPLFLDSIKVYKNKGLTSVQEYKGLSDIVRKNQAYQLFLEYEFLGTPGLALEDKEERIKNIEKKLPLGFHIEDVEYTWWNENAGKQIPLMLLAGIITIFIVCAILFDSLIWSLIPVLLIPLSYIGIFISVIIFKFKFDLGGIAAFLLVGGLSVNAAIFIINDYLNLKKRRKNLIPVQLYLKSFNGKIIPILLTALSTCLGLFPFLAFDKGQPFWYSLAICTVSGIIFSILAVILVLPIFFNLKN